MNSSQAIHSLGISVSHIPLSQFSGSGFKWLFFLLVFLTFFSGCNRSVNQLPVLPPVTHPLAREYIGYGVVNVSFTHFFDAPGTGGVSKGYLRRGTVVRIIERRPVTLGGNQVLWVFVEGNYQGTSSVSQGWLQEEDLDVYENESRAMTASRAIPQ